MRLFIAIEPDDKVKNYLKSIQEKLNSKDARLTIVKWHNLTLKFLGDVPEIQAKKIKTALSKIKFFGFGLETAEIRFFPDARNSKVIWIGIKLHQEIKRLQQDIENALQDIGFPKDKVFHPHITLARIKYVKI
jgi:2'-5' RNA ligase